MVKFIDLTHKSAILKWSNQKLQIGVINSIPTDLISSLTDM